MFLSRHAFVPTVLLLRAALGLDRSQQTSLAPVSPSSTDAQATLVRNAGDSKVAVRMLDSGHMHVVSDPAGHSGKSLHRKEASRVSLVHRKRADHPIELIKHKPERALAAKARLAAKASAASLDTIHKGKALSPATHVSSSGFEDHGDEWRATQRGYVRMKKDYDDEVDDADGSSGPFMANDDKEDDDDWDDDENKGTVADPFDQNATTGTMVEDDDGSAYDSSGMPVVNVTAEEDATTQPNQGPLKAVNPNPPAVPPPETKVEKLGEGIGAMAYERSPTGSRVINHDLRERLQLQDLATVVLLVSVFALTVLLSCCSVYQIADDPSPAAYYSEPKNYQQRVICETNDVDAFLAAFNTQPRNVRLRVVGRNPEPGGFRRFLRNLNAHASRPRGLAALLPMRQRRRLPVLFDIGLDMSPFITGDGRLSDENLEILQNYLNSKNKLETVLLQKKVDWPLWEDVATNIRQRLRTLGFPGEVEVRFECNDEVLIYQNHKWSNFVRNRVTQALVVISIIGSVFWIPYVWARSKTTKVETRFRVQVDPSRYWELVSDGLNAAEGFQSI